MLTEVFVVKNVLTSWVCDKTVFKVMKRCLTVYNVNSCRKISSKETCLPNCPYTASDLYIKGMMKPGYRIYERHGLRYRVYINAYMNADSCKEWTYSKC